MTDIEKERIVTLREAGWGYKRIAGETGLSENTIKSYCRRHKGKSNKPVVKGVPQPIRPRGPHCLHCGKAIKVLPGHRKRKFCSDACRLSYWKENQSLIQRRSAIRQTCTVCGKSFTDYANRHRKYCSRKCYQLARRGA